MNMELRNSRKTIEIREERNGEISRGDTEPTERKIRANGKLDRMHRIYRIAEKETYKLATSEYIAVETASCSVHLVNPVKNSPFPFLG